jgi:transcriptional regulator with XRE-family HTH domain
MLVAQRLDELRGRMTQTEIAQKSGLAQATIQRMLAGKVSPSVHVLEALGKALHCHPASFILDEVTAELVTACEALSRQDMAEVINTVKFKAYMNKSDFSDTMHFDDKKPILQIRRKFVSPLDAAVALDNSREQGNDGEHHQQTKLSRNRKTG